MSSAGTELTRIVAEFERRAREVPEDFYSCKKPANLLMHQQTERGCIEALSRGALFPLTGRAVLDIGCGVGSWMLEFVQWGADPKLVAGIDLSPARVEKAKLRLPQADVRVGSASKLPWPDASFDLVSQFTVFTSILDEEFRKSVAGEMLRVLRPGGAILWFDFRTSNPKNPNVRGIRASEIRRLFEDCQVDLLSTLLAPPVARFVAGWRPLAEILSAVPLLRTHYAGLIRKS